MNPINEPPGPGDCEYTITVQLRENHREGERCVRVVSELNNIAPSEQMEVFQHILVDSIEGLIRMSFNTGPETRIIVERDRVEPGEEYEQS